MSSHGGPNTGDAEVAAHFLRRQGWVALCVEDSDGQLRPLPAYLIQGGPDEVVLSLPNDTALSMAEAAPVALVADEFESYEGIRGLIARGTLTRETETSARMTVAHASGFSFAGKLSPSLRERKD